MGFEDDTNRWEQFLYACHLLSDCGYSGDILLRFKHGRVTRHTMDHLAELIRPLERKPSRPVAVSPLGEEEVVQPGGTHAR